jgi:hypothetical protein
MILRFYTASVEINLLRPARNGQEQPLTNSAQSGHLDVIIVCYALV